MRLAALSARRCCFAAALYPPFVAAALPRGPCRLRQSAEAGGRPVGTAPAAVALLSKKDGVVVCGAPNLSFLSALKVDTAKLPHHLSPAAAALDRTKVYVTFQSNEVRGPGCVPRAFLPAPAR